MATINELQDEVVEEPRKNCVDIQPMERPVTQASRQKEFEQLRTTDDHVMEIIGTFMKGKQRFYVCCNSWGKNWGNKGLIYLSEDYLRLKTIAVSMSEEAYLYDRSVRLVVPYSSPKDSINLLYI
jgi:aminopeptidase C